MYRLSKDASLSFLIGVELLQVCVGRNEVILNFDRNVRLTILSDFSVSIAGGRSIIYKETITGAVALFPLLHDVIEQARATEEGGLFLKFRSGMCVEAFDTSEQYESFWISNGDKQIIV